MQGNFWNKATLLKSYKYFACVSLFLNEVCCMVVEYLDFFQAMVIYFDLENWEI
jgi:hypothetical protein